MATGAEFKFRLTPLRSLLNYRVWERYESLSLLQLLVKQHDREDSLDLVRNQSNRSLTLDSKSLERQNKTSTLPYQ